MKDIKKLKEDDIEYEKCKQSPLYFYNTYIRAENEPVLTQEQFDKRRLMWEMTRGSRRKLPSSGYSTNNPFNYNIEDYFPVEWKYKNRPPSSAYSLPGIKATNYTHEDLVQDICKYFTISEENIRKHIRHRTIARPRQIAMYMLVKFFPLMSLVEIGKFMGGFTHSTVINSIKVVKDDMRTSKLFKSMVEEIEHTINDHRIEKDLEAEVKKV